MRRRRLLSLAGTALGAAVAGCSGSGDPGTSNETGGAKPETETTEDATTTGSGETTADPAIEIERHVGAGGFNPPHTLSVTDDGSVRWEVACPREGSDLVETELDADRHRELERAVLAADPETLAGEYGPDPDPDDETEVAVTDVPPVELTVRIGEQEHSLRYVTRNATPQRLNRLLELLDRIEQALSEPDCSTEREPPEVSATLRISAGFTPRPWRMEVTATDDGSLRFSHLCKRSGEETTAEGSIPEREASRLRERLLALELESLESEYTCDPDSCPTDLPGRRITLRVGDQHKEVYFYQPDPDAVPAELRALHAQLSRYADRFEADCRPETTEGDRSTDEVIQS